MTAFDRFDPFEQRIVDAIDEIAAPRRADYLDDVFRETARTSQRPRWTFPGRWIPIMDTTVPAPRRSSMRPLLLLGILALLALAATAILIVGARPRLPLPVGPARNGAILYSSDGNLYRRDTLTGDAVPVVATAATESAPYLSPDGRSVAFARTVPGGDELWAVDVDGSNPRRLLAAPLADGWSQWSWSTDSTHLLVSGAIDGQRRLYDLPADGSGGREIQVDGLVPWDAYWSPTDPNRFLLRAQKTAGVQAMDLYLADADGGNLRALGLPGQTMFGPQYTLSGESWSPDGRTIAYNAAALDPVSLITVFRVHLVNADGTGDRQLPGPADPTVSEGWPAWSPDGRQLLVHRFTLPSGQDTADGSGSIAIVPADGSSSGREIGARADGVAVSGVAKAWSPDGTQVLEFVDDANRAYVVDPATGSPTELPWADDIPDWQRLAP